MVDLFNPLGVKPGDYISWDTWCGPTTVKVTGVYPDMILLMSADGYDEGHDSLPRKSRVATEEDAAQFEKVRNGRVAPVAYE